MACSSNDLPASCRRFFPGSPFEPLRAGMTARTRRSAWGPTCALLSPRTCYLAEALAEDVVGRRPLTDALRDEEFVRQLDPAYDLGRSTEFLCPAAVRHPLDREALVPQERFDVSP